MTRLNEAEAVKTGSSAVEERDESRVFQALDSLTDIAGDFLFENKEEDAQRGILLIERLAQAATEQKMELVTINSVLSLGKLAKTAAEKGFDPVLSKAFIAIGKIGRVAAAHSLEAGSKISAETLMEVWNSSPEQLDQKKVIVFFLLLRDIGTTAAKKGMGEVVLNSTTCLGEIGKKVASEKFELETLSNLLLLEEIGRFAAENYLDEALSSVSLSIEEIGKLALKKKLNLAVLQSQWALETLRVQAEEKLLTNASVVAEMALDSFKDSAYLTLEERVEKFQEIKELNEKLYIDLQKN